MRLPAFQRSHNHRMEEKSGGPLGGGDGPLHHQPPHTHPASTAPPPAAHDDTLSLRKGAHKAWPAGGRKAKLESLAEGLTHRFFTSCAVKEAVGALRPEESGYNPSKTIKALGIAHGAARELLGSRR